MISPLSNLRVVAMDDNFSRCSSERPEKRGIVFSFLIMYNSPVNLIIFKITSKSKKNKKLRLLDPGQGFTSFFIISSCQDVKINCSLTIILRRK